MSGTGGVWVRALLMVLIVIQKREGAWRKLRHQFPLLVKATC